MNIFKKIVLALSLFFVAACVNTGTRIDPDIATGRRIDPDLAKKVQTCKTTQTEMLAWFGEPYRKGFENGLNVWLWSYASANAYTQKGEQQFIWASIDSKGTVVDYAYNSNEKYSARNSCS